MGVELPEDERRSLHKAHVPHFKILEGLAVGLHHGGTIRSETVNNPVPQDSPNACREIIRLRSRSAQQRLKHIAWIDQFLLLEQVKERALERLAIAQRHCAVGQKFLSQHADGWNDLDSFLSFNRQGGGTKTGKPAQPCAGHFRAKFPNRTLPMVFREDLHGVAVRNTQDMEANPRVVHPLAPGIRKPKPVVRGVNLNGIGAAMVAADVSPIEVPGRRIIRSFVDQDSLRHLARFHFCPPRNEARLQKGNLAVDPEAGCDQQIQTGTKRAADKNQVPGFQDLKSTGTVPLGFSGFGHAEWKGRRWTHGGASQMAYF